VVTRDPRNEQPLFSTLTINHINSKRRHLKVSGGQNTAAVALPLDVLESNLDEAHR